MRKTFRRKRHSVSIMSISCVAHSMDGTITVEPSIEGAKREHELRASDEVNGPTRLSLSAL